MPVEFAVIVAAFNTVLNTLNTALSLYSRSSAGKMLSYAFPFGALAFVVGIFLELVSEIQRAMFKRKPENKGKPYGAGLWSLATHINYGGVRDVRTVRSNARLTHHAVYLMAGRICLRSWKSWLGRLGRIVRRRRLRPKSNSQHGQVL